MGACATTYTFVLREALWASAARIIGRLSNYLLDTDVLINWLRGVREVRQRIRDLAEEQHELAVCCISVGELYSGLREDNRSEAERILADVDYWDIGRTAAELSGAYRYHYSRQGVQISIADALQAALAVTSDATLVTGNVRDFPMPELRLLRLP